MDFLAQSQLVMVSGKGGVGKTTLSCGLARQVAQQHPQASVMLLSTDPAHSLGDVLTLTVDNTPTAMADVPNLWVRALDARSLLEQFRQDYGPLLELLIERGSLIAGDDLSPLWDMGWPGLDELMALLEIQRLLRQRQADRVVVDMAPSGHTLSLFALMDFLDTLLVSLNSFQDKHRYMTRALSGQYTPDQADQFLQTMGQDLKAGRALLQDRQRTACWVVGIPEPMSLRESQRFIKALRHLAVPLGGIIINRVQLQGGQIEAGQWPVLQDFRALLPDQNLFWVPQQETEPIGGDALDQLVAEMKPLNQQQQDNDVPAGALPWPQPVAPGFEDFIAAGRRLLIVGGKGGVGKTTVSAAIGWALALSHPEAAIRVMSIDPAHSLGDAFGQPLGHEPTPLLPNLQGQEVNADIILEDFKRDYLWELADMMGGDAHLSEGLHVAYGPEAWRQIVSQALPGIDEMLALITVMDLLEHEQQQLIVLDTAPTGHLLRFLAMPNALGDWLAWIFKLWIKYQAVAGHVELMGRLRTLRQRVMAAQAKLKDPAHSEFIGVVQNQAAILAEAQRLTQTLATMDMGQRYIVHNRYLSDQDLPSNSFPGQTIVRLPQLPVANPNDQVKGAAGLIFAKD